MKIVHVTSSARRIGGTQAHLLALAEAQSARGDEVAVAHGDGAATLPEGVREVRLADADWLRAVLEEMRPDVVHVHGTPLPAPVELELQRRVPVVRSLHDFSFGCASGEHWFRDGTVCTRAHGPACVANFVARGCAHRVDLRQPLRAYRDIARRLPLLRATRRVVVYSDFVRGIALRNGILAERCHMIPYFVRRAPVPPAPPHSERDVAFVGRIVVGKGLDVLLRALATRPRDWDRLLVVGDGWDRGRCERLIRRHGLRDRVRMLGWLDERGVASVLAETRVLALPSRWPEPFGIVGLEAMAAARPVVATAVGGIPEWLDDGETGLLVPSGDVEALAAALARVLGDEELAARLGRTGWERAARFAPDHHLAMLDAAYSEAA